MWVGLYPESIRWVADSRCVMRIWVRDGAEGALRLGDCHCASCTFSKVRHQYLKESATLVTCLNCATGRTVANTIATRARDSTVVLVLDEATDFSTGAVFSQACGAKSCCCQNGLYFGDGYLRKDFRF